MHTVLDLQVSGLRFNTHYEHQFTARHTTCCMSCGGLWHSSGELIRKLIIPNDLYDLNCSIEGRLILKSCVIM